MNFPDYLKQRQQRVNQALECYLPTADQNPQRLHEAMRYAVLNGGKRIRPLLVYATGEAFGAKLEELDEPACAIELIHCYSLVHDDLPAMDNDDLRRGMPTCHKAFDEATAILVGDALQSLAFSLLSQNAKPNANARLQMLAALSHGSGSLGMAGGQALDLEATGKKLNLEQLEKMHRLKTGALISASIKLGALAANCNAEQLAMLDKFSQHIGLAFQIQDDILDIEGTTEILGKQQGADIKQDKSTYPALMGLATAKEKVQQLYNQAIELLKALDNPVNYLQFLAGYIVQRNY